jgi:valyl-tRNA synthetase
LGWPKLTEDLTTYHPTSVLETGYDILFFWVARMILMSGYHLGTIPFHKVYLHGLVRDEKGKKMSKSLGNIIDPLQMSEKYGADATRLSLIIGNPPGNDLKLSEDKIRGYKHFSNKIWNASRFVLEHLSDDFNPTIKVKYSNKDKESLDELQNLVKEVSLDIESFRFYLAAEKLYQYFWHTFADVIIEENKQRLTGEDEGERKAAEKLLYTLLETELRLLHPFMPYITEEIWQTLPSKDKVPLLISSWPTA